MLHGEAIHRSIQGRRRPDESQDSLDDSELSLGWQESNHPHQADARRYIGGHRSRYLAARDENRGTGQAPSVLSVSSAEVTAANSRNVSEPGAPVSNPDPPTGGMDPPTAQNGGSTTRDGKPVKSTDLRR